ncbi:36900_t:CDS:2, partial [Racocetra persica]
MAKIVNQEREGPISGTPTSYVDIYQKCWSPEPSLRPELDVILENLITLSNGIHCNFIITNGVDDLSDLLDRLFYNLSSLTNSGVEFSQISKKIQVLISEEDQTARNIFDLLCIRTAFNMFKQAKNGNTMAKFYFGECYRNGYGTIKNLASAKLWYKDITDECARAANSL